MKTPKITPENCHRIKQTACGQKVTDVIVIPDSWKKTSFAGCPVGAYVDGHGFEWFQLDGSHKLMAKRFWLDLSPLSEPEPEPTPVAQAAIGLIESQTAYYAELYTKANYAGKWTLKEQGMIEACNSIKSTLIHLFTARVGETIKPL